MRLDKFLKVSRVIKRRTLAKEVCDGGRVSINGRVAKPSSEVKAGDILELDFGTKKVKVEIVDTPASVRADQAKDIYRVLEETRVLTGE
ncbi:MAG: RNA-binding S4 domain-containing protein [Thermincola sp.]|nr:RNA-binding S4 domain-containing protein [Thermincola sp.]MDT3702126.1 RNA-binding S4 domain-containing protein [Thermincola sp.]